MKLQTGSDMPSFSSSNARIGRGQHLPKSTFRGIADQAAVASPTVGPTLKPFASLPKIEVDTFTRSTPAPTPLAKVNGSTPLTGSANRTTTILPAKVSQDVIDLSTWVRHWAESLNEKIKQWTKGLWQSIWGSVERMTRPPKLTPIAPTLTASLNAIWAPPVSKSPVPLSTPWVTVGNDQKGTILKYALDPNLPSLRVVPETVFKRLWPELMPKTETPSIDFNNSTLYLGILPEANVRGQIPELGHVTLYPDTQSIEAKVTVGDPPSGGKSALRPGLPWVLFTLNNPQVGQATQLRLVTEGPSPEPTLSTAKKALSPVGTTPTDSANPFQHVSIVQKTASIPLFGSQGNTTGPGSHNIPLSINPKNPFQWHIPQKD